jgi:LacI family transcriptional regulator
MDSPFTFHILSSTEGVPMATIADVAREAGVSISTVSKAMNNRRDVSEATRHKVLATIERLDYHYDSAARGLRTKRSMMIGAVVQYLEHDYFQRIISGVESAAFARGYNVVISNCQLSLDRERALVKSFLQRRIDGLIFALPMTNNAELLEMAERGARFVVVGLPLAGAPKTATICADHEGGAYNAAIHLHRVHGKRRIAFIHGPPEQEDCFHGYCRALTDLGLPFNPELTGYAQRSAENAGVALEKIVRQGLRPDAVLCFNDELAHGVYLKAARLGLRIPDDLAVVGVDDSRIASCLSPGLTSVGVPTFQMGELAANELIDLLENGGDGDGSHVLPTSLVIRGSCGCDEHLD